MAIRVKYWLTELERAGADNVFDTAIRHGDRVLSYRFTVEYAEPLHVINADRRYQPDFPDDDGVAACNHLYRWLVEAARGATLALPIDLTEAPAPVEPYLGVADPDAPET